MGRGKMKRTAKRAAKAKRRREIKKKMGKPIYLTLIRPPWLMFDVYNRFIYKATINRALYKYSIIYNVRWQASSLTDCNFSDSDCLGVDFLNSNLKRTSFKNANLMDVVFFNCNLKGTDFTGTQFHRVAFIATNTDVAKNLTLTKECHIYRTYPNLELDPETEKALLELSKYSPLYKFGVLFVNRSKLNKWIIQFLIDIYGEDSLRALIALKEEKNKRYLFSVYSYIQRIDKYLKP